MGLSVYRHSGEDIKEDLRRIAEYRKRVLDGLGFGEGATRPGLTEADMAACREVLSQGGSFLD